MSDHFAQPPTVAEFAAVLRDVLHDSEVWGSLSVIVRRRATGLLDRTLAANLGTPLPLDPCMEDDAMTDRMAAPQGERLAAVETQFQNVQDTLRGLTAMIAELRNEVTALRTAIDQAKGGMRVVMVLGSIFSAATVVNLWHWFGPTPPGGTH
jgi:hypothetical protein